MITGAHKRNWREFESDMKLTGVMSACSPAVGIIVSIYPLRKIVDAWLCIDCVVARIRTDTESSWLSFQLALEITRLLGIRVVSLRMRCAHLASITMRYSMCLLRLCI